jgi:hypothetical protein
MSAISRAISRSVMPSAASSCRIRFITCPKTKSGSVSAAASFRTDVTPA